MPSKRVLVVDDDKRVIKMISLFLSSEDFEVFTAESGLDALAFLENNTVDIILMDVIMPELDGMETLRILRKTYETPVLLLTAKGLLEDKLEGFAAGADDYIIKPFEPRELLARIEARLKSSGDSKLDPSLHTAGPISVNLESYLVSVDGERIEGLKPKEVQLLNHLVVNKNKVMTRSALLSSVWGYDVSVDTRTVDVHIKSLRKALGEHGAIIKTIWGVGYKVESP